MFRLAQLMLCAAMLSACRGGDDATTAAPSAAVVANTVAVSVAEGMDLLAYVGQTKTVTLSFKTSDGNTATKLNLSLPATPGWQSQTGALSCATVNREGGCVLRLSYAPTQAAAAATLRLPYSYIDSAGANQNGSVTLNYRALAANAAVVTATPNPVSGIVSQQSVVTIDFATNDGTIASGLSASYALPNAWTSDAVNFTCASFGAGTPCRLTLRYAPNQATTQSSFKVGFSYTDSAGKQQLDAITISYAAAVPNTAMVDIGGPNLPSSTLIAVDPGGTQDVSFTFTPSDRQALSNLQLAQGATLPAGWTSDTALSSFSCASVTQDGQCQLVLHFKPAAGQALPRQTLTLPYTYRNAVGQSLSGSASIDYTSRIYRLYAAGSQAAPGVSQCWLKMADGATKYDLNACDDPGTASPPAGLRRMVINGLKAYLLDASAELIHVCDLDGDGGLLDCIDGIKVPTNVTSMAQVADALYVLVGQGVDATLWACPIASNAGCEPVKIDTLGIKFGGIIALANDGDVLYLLDNGQLQVLRCARPAGAGFNVQCESIPQSEITQFFTTMAAGLLSDTSHVFLGRNVGNGPEIRQCSVNPPSPDAPPQCGPVLPASNDIGLSLIDLQFTYNDSGEPALYLLVSKELDSTRGVIRCRLANASTATSAIGDLVSCGGYVPFAPSTLGRPSGITLR